MLGFVRIVTQSKIYQNAMTIPQAWHQANQWLALGHREILGRLLAMIPDAHLAALAIEHGLTLCSTDGDFTRFKGLRFLNPLAVE